MVKVNSVGVYISDGGFTRLLPEWLCIEVMRK